MTAEEYARLAELTGRRPMPCQHSRVYPIRERFLCFHCLDCRKQIEVRDARSLRILRPVFMHAAYLLSRGCKWGRMRETDNLFFAIVIYCHIENCI
jgi:hypothetical protein